MRGGRDDDGLIDAWGVLGVDGAREVVLEEGRRSRAVMGLWSLFVNASMEV